jgi:hypothetical protein
MPLLQGGLFRMFQVHSVRDGYSGLAASYYHHTYRLLWQIYGVSYFLISNPFSAVFPASYHGSVQRIKKN